jgi:hypothetical protein
MPPGSAVGQKRSAARSERVNRAGVELDRLFVADPVTWQRLATQLVMNVRQAKRTARRDTTYFFSSNAPRKPSRETMELHRRPVDLSSEALASLDYLECTGDPFFDVYVNAVTAAVTMCRGRQTADLGFVLALLRNPI